MAEIFAHYNKDTGMVIGFFSSEIHTKIPEPYISITEEQWKTCLKNQTSYKVLEGNLITIRPSSETVKEQKRTALNCLYVPQFDELERAYGRSLMIGDTENSLLIRKEYQELWTEYNKKMEEINNGK